MTFDIVKDAGLLTVGGVFVHNKGLEGLLEVEISAGEDGAAKQAAAVVVFCMTKLGGG